MRYVFLDPEEILRTSDFSFVRTFLRDTRRTEVGWHYLVDLAWIYSRVRDWPRHYRILDAGGGRGPTQFLLAELGFDVTNLDLALNKPEPSIQKRYRMKFETSSQYEKTTYVDHLSHYSNTRPVLRSLRNVVYGSSPYQAFSSRRYRKIHDKWRKDNGIVSKVGRLEWMRSNLCGVPEFAAHSFDAVVSLSSLEHIPTDFLPQAWAEIIRICKPDFKVAITTSATEQQETWFHNPSQGNCFSEYDLQRFFEAQPASNNLPASEMTEKYRACTYLRDNLADFYSMSGENGMPWGEWDPLYFPVGIFQ